MIFYILAAILIIVIIVIFASAIYEDGLEGFFWGIGFSVLATIIWGLLAFPLLMGIASANPNVERVEQTQLQALGNDSEISGSFFLGSGYIDEELVYNYIIKHEDGALELKSIEAKDVLIYEDAEPGEAYLESVQRFAEHWWLAPGNFPTFGIDYEFHIPPGSVDNTYTVSVH